MNMKKVLFSFAGHRDPFGEGGNEGSVVTLVRHTFPDEVVLMAVNEEGKNFAEQSAEWMNLEDVMGLSRDRIYIESVVGDPVDYSAALEIVHDILIRHRKRCLEITNKEDLEFIANASSGTPAMKTAMILAKHMGLLGAGSVFQVRNPIYVDSEHPHISVIRIGFLEEESLRRECLGAIETQQFVRAKELLSRLDITTFSETVHSSVFWLKRMLNGLERWELSEYTKALEELKKSRELMNKATVFNELRDHVNRQIKWLSEKDLISNQETEMNLFELYQSVSRYYQSRRFTDGLARFWRLVEGTIYWRFLKEYHINIKKLDTLKLPESVASRLNDSGMLQLTSARGRQDIFWMLELLRNMNDVPFKGWLETSLRNGENTITVSEQLHRLRSQRNHSLAAHGMQPVSENDLHQAVIIARHLVINVLPGADQLQSEYPFHPLQLTDLLRAHWTRGNHDAR